MPCGANTKYGRLRHKAEAFSVPNASNPKEVAHASGCDVTGKELTVHAEEERTQSAEHNELAGTDYTRYREGGVDSVLLLGGSCISRESVVIIISVYR